MNAVKENIINIDGAKLKTLLESATGKTLREISLENGFSDSFLRMVVKSNKATPTAQAVIRLYGIQPSAYEIKEPVTETEPATSDNKQLTIDDILTPDAKEILRQFIRESVFDAFKVASSVDFSTIATTKPESIKAKHAGEVKGAGDKWAI